MKKLLLILLCYPLIGFGQQPNYTVTVNTPDAWQANLFFQLGGPPIKPVKIIDSTGTEIFSENIGIVMGSESKGLRELVKKNCDMTAKINIKRSIESLNVSVALAITLYEINRT